MGLTDRDGLETHASRRSSSHPVSGSQKPTTCFPSGPITPSDWLSTVTRFRFTSRTRSRTFAFGSRPLGVDVTRNFTKVALEGSRLPASPVTVFQSAARSGFGSENVPECARNKRPSTDPIPAAAAAPEPCDSAKATGLRFEPAGTVAQDQVSSEGFAPSGDRPNSVARSWTAEDTRTTDPKASVSSAGKCVADSG